jgi:hypothetical protein
MAVDLSDLVDSLKREVNAPGLTQLPDATDTQYLGNLQDGFWEAVLDGLIEGYTETDGIVTPVSGTTDLSRELQQLVVFYAGFRIVRNLMRDLKTAFKASAGPVSYETEQSANLLKSILDDLKGKRNFLLNRLSDLGAVNSVYIDALSARDDSINYRDTYWVS